MIRSKVNGGPSSGPGASQQATLETVHLIQMSPMPLTLQKGLLVTVAHEFAPGKLVLGRDEPGYLIAERPTSLSLAKPKPLTSAGPSTSFSNQNLHFIEDQSVQNKVCSQILSLPGYDAESFPFLVARNRCLFTMLNTKTLKSFSLISDLSSTAWYQKSVLLLNA